MDLINYLDVDESSGFFEPAFRQVLEDHLEIIKKTGTTQTFTIAAITATRFQGDYFGLLTYVNIPHFLHWITMRVNGLVSPADTIADIPMVQTVDINYIRLLYNTHRTQSQTKKTTNK